MGQYGIEKLAHCLITQLLH